MRRIKMEIFNVTPLLIRWQVDPLKPVLHTQLLTLVQEPRPEQTVVLEAAMPSQVTV